MMSPLIPDFKGMISSEAARRVLADLVSLSSVNPFEREVYTWPPFGEAKLAEYVAEFMTRFGCKVFLQEVLPGRPNVIASLQGSEVCNKALLLEAHLDTVQIDNMTIKPFVPMVYGGRLYGRGACDTKASLAAMMLAIKLVANTACKRPTVHLAATVDEEYKYRGVQQIIESRMLLDACIVGEPTKLDIIVAHKGCIRWRILTHGKAAHSSCPGEGVNAIEKMVNVIIGLRKHLELKYARQEHPLIGCPTLSIGLISGGIGVNTVPDQCLIHLDRRTLPGEQVELVLKEINCVLDVLREEDPFLDVSMEDPYLVDIPLDMSANTPIVKCVSRASTSITGDFRITGVPYGTDASKIAASGVPSIVFGPGSIADAHSAEESVELRQVAQAAEILAQTIVLFGGIYED